MKKLNLFFVLITFSIFAFSQAPTITSFSPASGPVGTLVTITGTNLSSPTAFTIGGVAAIVVSDNGTTLVGMVMPGAATGAVSVTTAGGTALGSSNFTITPTFFPSVQQSNKLLGTGVLGTVAQQGYVSVSADGNTAIVGGPGDDNTIGAAWIWTRADTTWTQQAKLVGTGYIGSNVDQGISAAISADGNTAIIGAYADDSSAGAAWVFTRVGSIWTQQGNKLVGTGAINGALGAQQGWSVSLSADGNTAIVGGYWDNDGAGAAWVYNRSGGTWTQQGAKLVGSGAINGPFGAHQGGAVSLSADGNTALIGGPFDDDTGAVWVYIRSGGIWTQQGPKLVGTGAVGSNQNYSNQGSSVSLSADGNTAMEGADADSNSTGAVWVFIRSGSIWTQQGNKLVGSGAVGAAWQGISVSLCADGNTAIVGGDRDNSETGAAWIYTRSGGVWTQQGAKLVGSGANTSAQGWTVSLAADGNTALIGGPVDNGQNGGAWVFVTCPGANSSSITQRICYGDTFIFGSQYLTASGIYTNTLNNVSGCDSIITLTLTVDTVTANFTLQPSGTPHLWYALNQCTGPAPLTYLWNWGDNTTSTGDTPTHTYDTAGYYMVCVTATDSFGCSAHYCDTSVYLFKNGSGAQMVYVNVVNHIPNDISEINGPSAIHLYPNPNKGSFTLATTNSINSDYTISDMLGHVLAQQAILSDSQSIELPEAAEGVYTLVVKGASPIRFVVVK